MCGAHLVKDLNMSEITLMPDDASPGQQVSLWGPASVPLLGIAENGNRAHGARASGAYPSTNSMRPDLAQMLADLNPGLMRFPGGCYVESGDPCMHALAPVCRRRSKDSAFQPAPLLSIAVAGREPNGKSRFKE
jgi:hypothetical protein